ncbi:SRPBCC family protein [Spongiimicrobium sp. 2-473A-2-J]|uniref:SRPBCC family protein n=1 Tax=Eudoraea algarum TaxID=3417568 RepID=UPI003D35AE80
MNKLQNTLLANAIFSGMSGIGLLLFHKEIADIFSVNSSTTFWIVGIALIYFASTITYEIFKQRPIPILFIIIQDILWVIGSIILLVSQPFGISITGNYIIAAIALIVFFMAIAQSKALSKVDTIDADGKKRLRFKTIFNANGTKVWKVISDVGNVYKVAPNIDDSSIVSGNGEGMIRSCSHGKDSWTETCSLWKEEEAISFVVHTDKPDYPYPLSFLQGAWYIKEIDSNNTEVEMIFDLKFKNKLQNLFVYPLMKFKFGKSFNVLLDNWKAIIEEHSNGSWFFA